MDFDAEGETEAAKGDGEARVVSTTEGAETTVTAGVVQMEFASAGGESALTKAVAAGGAVVVSKPLRWRGARCAETRVLRSDTVEIRMRPGGREIEEVDTHARGTLEFLPNRPATTGALLEGERMWIGYGERNQHQFVPRGGREDPHGTHRGRARSGAPAMLTRSKGMQAEFDPEDGRR